jgi:hypothetical protein
MVLFGFLQLFFFGHQTDLKRNFSEGGFVICLGPEDKPWKQRGWSFCCGSEDRAGFSGENG